MIVFVRITVLEKGRIAGVDKVHALSLVELHAFTSVLAFTCDSEVRTHWGLIFPFLFICPSV
jgi:hypothetical protein